MTRAVAAGGTTVPGRFFSLVLTVTLLLPLAVVGARPAAAVTASTPIEIGARQVDGDGEAVTSPHLGATKTVVPGEDIVQATFEGQTTEESCRTRLGLTSWCLYRMTYVEGVDAGGVVRKVQVASMRREGPDNDQIVITPAEDPNHPDQDNVEMVLTEAQAREKVHVEFLSASDFVAVEYDLAGTHFSSFTGTGFVTRSRQILTRSTGDVEALLNVTLPREYSVSFTRAGVVPDTDVTVTVASTVDRDTSTPTVTRQALALTLGDLGSAREVSVRVATPSKATMGFTATSSVLKSEGLGRLFAANPVVELQRGSSDLRWQGRAVVTAKQETVKSSTDAANYFVSQVRVNGQGFDVPFPQQWTARKATQAQWEADYVSWREAHVGRVLLDTVVASGVNAGTRVKVTLKDARVRADTHPLGTGLEDPATGISETSAGFNHWWGGQFGYLWRTLYEVEVSNLVTSETTVAVQFSATSNMVLQNSSSRGFVTKSGQLDAINVWSRVEKDGVLQPYAWRNLCTGSWVAPCSWLAAKWLNLSEKGHADEYRVALTFRNGHGAPTFSEEDATCPNGEPVALTEGVRTCRTAGGDVAVAGEPITPLWVSVGGTLTPVAMGAPDADGALTAWVPVGQIGSFKARSAANLSTEYPLHTDEAQSLVAFSSPFTFAVTQKVAATRDAAELEGTMSQQGLNVRDNFIIAVDRTIPTLANGAPFIGYNLYACSPDSCWPVRGTAASSTLETCRTSTTYTVDAAHLTSAQRRELPVFFPGDTVNLEEWGICWQDVPGVQQVTELRFVPAEDAAASLVGLTYHADAVEVVDGRARTTTLFRFQAVPGVEVRFADAWWEDEANAARTVRTAAGEVILSRDEADARTVRASRAGASTSAAPLRVVFTPSRVPVKVLVNWRVNGSAVTQPPSASSAVVSLDGASVPVGEDVGSFSAGDELLLAVESTSPCRVESSTVSGGSLAGSVGVDARRGESARVVVGQEPSRNVWTVVNEVSCPTAALTLRKTFNDLADAVHEPNPVDWALGVRPHGVPGAPAVVSHGSSVTVDPGVHVLAGERVAAPSVDLSPFVDASEWRCRADAGVGAGGSSVSVSGGSVVQLPVGVSAVSCDWPSTVGELTVVVDVRGGSGGGGARAAEGVGSSSAAGSATVARVQAPALIAEVGAAGDLVRAVGAPQAWSVVRAAVSASDWTVRAIPVVEGARRMARAVSASGVAPEPLVFSGSPVGEASKEGVEAHFVRPGTTYLLEEDGPDDMWIVARERYVGDEPFRDAFLSDASMWEPLVDSTVTIDEVPESRDVVRILAVEPPAVQLPLTGGTGRDVFLVLGGGGLLVALLVAVAVRRRGVAW